jgi:hypothetical protein
MKRLSIVGDRDFELPARNYVTLLDAEFAWFSPKNERMGVWEKFGENFPP